MQSQEATKDAFRREVRHVLLSLYDPAELRRNALVSLFALDKKTNPSTAVRQTMTDAIQSLNPGPLVPVGSSAWRIFQVLVYRYVEQSDQQTVANNLAISVRQLQRLEREAEQVLADYLWERYDLGPQEKKLLALLEPKAQPSAEHNVVLSGLEQELTWLQESSPTEAASIAEMVRVTVETHLPLAENLGVTIEAEMPQQAPEVTGQLVILRQALSDLLAAAVYAAQGGKVRIEVVAEEHGTMLRVQAESSLAGGGAEARQIGEHLDMARKLASLFGSALEGAQSPVPGSTLSVTLTLAAAERLPVLVIDDNTDTLRLLQRYLSGTSYRFVGAHDPEQAVALAQETAPHVIVMDVMMPGVDGWEMLGRLRAHPATRNVPIIVCTILPHEPLALALGASGFLRKPVSRDAFLAALGRQAGSPSRE